MAERATKDSWTIEPMPARRERIALSRRFSPDEYERLARGHIPASQDDRWFIYVEEQVAHVHRSWTGFCIFEVELAPFGDGYEVTAAWANRDSEQGMDGEFDSVAAGLLDRLSKG